MVNNLKNIYILDLDDSCGDISFTHSLYTPHILFNLQRFCWGVVYGSDPYLNLRGVNLNARLVVDGYHSTVYNDTTKSDSLVVLPQRFDSIRFDCIGPLQDVLALEHGGLSHLLLTFTHHLYDNLHKLFRRSIDIAWSKREL